MSDHDGVPTEKSEPHHRAVVGHKLYGDGETKSAWRAVWYFCPACKETHNVDLNEAGRESPRWSWNGDLVNPTFAPSVNYSSRICHHNVEGGTIIFHGDCTHAMKNTRVPLPPISEWPRYYLEVLGIPVDDPMRA